MRDPVDDFIALQRVALVRAAPAPNAARVWHEARRRRAGTLGRSAQIAGWVCRLAVALVAAASLVPLRPESYFLLLLVAMTGWLTRGACAWPHRIFNKGAIQ